MQITFDTTTITDDEVRGIFALLDTVRPEARAVGEPDWMGVKIIKRVDTNEEVSRGPVKLAEETVEDHLAEVAAIPETDSTGLVWDERIHASSKALNADGTWRTKRGVDKALVAEVEAELRSTVQVVHSDGSTTIPDSPTPPETVVYEPGGALAEAALIAPPAPPAAPEAPKAPLAPAVTQSAPVAPSSAVSPFVALMKRVTTAQGAGKLTQPRVKELLESLDKKSIMDLRTDEDALASFAVLLTAELNGTLAEVAEACGGLKPENIKSILAILPGEEV